MKPDDIRAALALLNDPEISVRSAARKLSLSVSTLYSHAPGLRSRLAKVLRPDADPAAAPMAVPHRLTAAVSFDPV